MKVLHVIDSEGFYGAETVLINLVAEQKEQGLEPLILNMRPADPAFYSLEAEALKQGLPFLAVPLKAGLDVAGAWKILQYAKQHKFDILHSHGYKSNILLGLIPKMLRKLPMISTLHGWTSTKKFTKIWAFEQLDLFSLKFMDALTVVNNAMKNHQRLKNSKLTLQVVNNGIPPITFESSQLDEKIKQFCSKGFSIGAIGRLSKEKGFEYLIESLGLLTAQGIDAHLVIIGEGSERTFLEETTNSLNLQHKVLMPGFRENARNYLPLFSVFAITSLTEGLPITLLEAMQAKVPIVATQVGGIPEVLEHMVTAFLIPPANSEAIANALIKIKSNKQLFEKNSACAYAKVIAEYSSKKMAKRYYSLYRNCIDS